MLDPQGSMAFVLKPPDNFESVYEGQSCTIPIPFVAANSQGRFTPLDDLVGSSRGIAANLERFVPVSLGSKILILIPRALYQDGASLRSKTYLYDFRWRLRSVDDYADAQQVGNPTHPYQLVTTLGAPSVPAPTARRVIPAYTSEQVTPATAGSLLRPLIDASTFASVSQGVYDPADFSGAGDPAAGNTALGITYFPPYVRMVLGNELSIVASFGSGNWSFGDTGATGDAGFSNVFGTNIAGTDHASYPGVGIYVILLATAATP